MTQLSPARWVAALCLALLASTGNTQDALDGRLRELETQLRCLVCQNQTLADSDAPLAVDLRREIREMANAGRTDTEIRAFLVDRYGDFVLYSPPLKPTTWLLWLGPFALLLLGGAVWGLVLRRRRTGALPPAGRPPSPGALARARDVLDE